VYANNPFNSDRCGLFIKRSSTDPPSRCPFGKLENGWQACYHGSMSDNGSSSTTPKSWFDAIERSEAELAAGQLLDFQEVMREFDAEDASDLDRAKKPLASHKPRQSAAR
jgi:hypothetical protein